MANRKNITVVRRGKIEVTKLGAPHYERLGEKHVFDPMPARTPLNVQPKMDVTPETSQARSNFTTPFNLTPKVADKEDV